MYILTSIKYLISTVASRMYCMYCISLYLPTLTCIHRSKRLSPAVSASSFSADAKYSLHRWRNNYSDK